MKTIPAKNTSRTITPIINETKIRTSEQQMSPISQNEKPNVNSNDVLNMADTTPEIESSQISISTETIYLLLTGKLERVLFFKKKYVFLLIVI